MKITRQMLVHRGACEGGLEDFDIVAPFGAMEVTARNLCYFHERDVLWFILEWGTPLKSCREELLLSPTTARYVATHVDQEPRDDTRALALGDPHDAYLYAKYVDCGPRLDTWKASGIYRDAYELRVPL